MTIDQEQGTRPLLLVAFLAFNMPFNALLLLNLFNCEKKSTFMLMFFLK